MNKDIEEIFKLIKEKKCKHLCFIAEKDFIAVSQSCDENDLYKFLYSICVNVPWAQEVIEKFVDDLEEEDDEITDDEPQYIN